MSPVSQRQRRRSLSYLILLYSVLPLNPHHSLETGLVLINSNTTHYTFTRFTLSTDSASYQTIQCSPYCHSSRSQRLLQPRMLLRRRLYRSKLLKRTSSVSDAFTRSCPPTTTMSSSLGTLTWLRFTLYPMRPVSYTHLTLPTKRIV